jgi:hypothetical protein
MRKHCEGAPWFPKVEPLFTEPGKRNMHPETVDAIGRVVTKRLNK